MYMKKIVWLLMLVVSIIMSVLSAKKEWPVSFFIFIMMGSFSIVFLAMELWGDDYVDEKVNRVLNNEKSYVRVQNDKKIRQEELNYDEDGIKNREIIDETVEISEKWIWKLVLEPNFIILITTLLCRIIMENTAMLNKILINVIAAGSLSLAYFAYFCSIILIIVYMVCDIYEVRQLNEREWKKTEKLIYFLWLISPFLQYIFVPIYIFIREKKTNKNYAPLIVWGIIFVINCCIILM